MYTSRAKQYEPITRDRSITLDYVIISAPSAHRGPAIVRINHPRRVGYVRARAYCLLRNITWWGYVPLVA